ncbi:hypothetical protein [Umezakia ovalisporum]|uniref:hypothetical protein n=1 Tax=Umezakia ovalisporum TaxID=75695 RepID=UPI00247560D7|nr:hypothetical protein [Umezakia ovalisporum]MDH6095989.1 hypothetical protein [Umezakia ovalisporum CobakiLakeB]
MPDFIRSANNITTILKIGEQNPKPPVEITSPERENLRFLPKTNHFHTIELPLVFSHMSFLLIETLSETQHGELVISSKKGKYETMVELSGHISHRYNLSSQELQQLQQLHDYILETWIAWRQSYKAR